MHSASGPCQTLNINESIIHCQEVTVGTAAHSWTGARNGVDPSRRSIHSVTEWLGQHSRDNSDGMIVFYTARHLLIFHQNKCCGWRVCWRDAGALIGYTATGIEKWKPAPCWITCSQHSRMWHRCVFAWDCEQEKSNWMWHFHTFQFPILSGSLSNGTKIQIFVKCDLTEYNWLVWTDNHKPTQTCWCMTYQKSDTLEFFW